MAPRSRRYQLDGRHNWVSREASSPALAATTDRNALDGYTRFGTVSPTYDLNGALASFGASQQFSYNLFGELASVTRGEITHHYEYDAFGRLAAQSGGPRGDVRFGYDGANLAFDVSSEDVEAYLTGSTVDDLVAAFGPEGLRRFYHQDRSGSVYMISDATGAVIETYDYTAYGELTARDAQGIVVDVSTSGLRFGYQGHLHDPGFDLVYMRQRWYSPSLGRFLNPDPIGLLGGSNLYSFVMSAPLRWTDPFGLAPQAPPQSQSITSGFWRGLGSLTPAHTGAFMRPPRDDAFGLVRGTAIQQAQGGVGRIGLLTGAAAVGAYGLIQTGAMAAPVVVPALKAAGAAVAQEAAIAKFAAESMAAAHPGLTALVTGIAAGESGVIISAPMSPARVAGAGGAWRVLNEVADPRVVQQLTDNACGPACGQMLLREAGTEVFQSNVANAAGGVLTAPETLARALNTLQGVTTWAGGTIERAALQAAARTGPFAAMLWQPGNRIGHWVVVDAIDNGLVGIRDPAHATSYVMKLADFLEAWTDTVVLRRR